VKRTNCARWVAALPCLLIAAACPPAQAQAQVQAQDRGGAKDPAKDWTLQEALGDPEGLTVTGALRVRYEAIGDQFRPGYRASEDALMLNTSIAAQYDSGPVRLAAELMDARVYGAGADSSISNNEVNALAFVQAYVGFDLGDGLGAGSTTSLEAGRFTMDLGSRRLSARNAFRNTLNAFTGFRAEYGGKDGTEVTAFYTLPAIRLPDDMGGIVDNKVESDSQSFDLTFWGVFASHPLGGGTKVEAYLLGLDEKDRPDTATRNRHLRTPGARVVRKPRAGGFDFEVEGAYQFGSVRSGTSLDAARQDVSAYFLQGTVGYTFALPVKPRLSFEYSVASGDRKGGAYNRFDTLYGARRFEFGPTSLYGPLGRANIRSPGVRLEVAPGPRWDVMAMYRAAWLESRTDSFSSTGVRDASGAAGSFAGQQVEARARYWLVPKRLQLEAGGAVLFNGAFLDTAANANGRGDPVYGYMQMTTTF